MSDTPKEEQLDTKPVKNDPPIKPRNSKSVAVYLVILFAAAFLLLLMAYFMQQRSSNEVIDNLQDSVSQFQTVDELREENQKLREEIAALEGTAEDLQSLQAQLETLTEDLASMTRDYESMADKYAIASEHQKYADAHFDSTYILYWAECCLLDGDPQRAAEVLVKALPTETLLYGIQHFDNGGAPEFTLQPRYDELVKKLTDLGLLTQAEDGTLLLAEPNS